MTYLRRHPVLVAIAILCLSLEVMAQSTSNKPAPGAPKSQTLVLSFGPAVNNPEGQAAAARLMQTLGGPKQVDAVKTLRQRFVLLRENQKTDVEQTIVYPDKQAQQYKSTQGAMLRVVTPEEAFKVSGSQVTDLPANEAASSRSALAHDFLNVMQHTHDPNYAFEATGQERVDDIDTTFVSVNAAGTPIRWWIAADGKLVQECFTDLAQTVPTTLTFRYSDWRKFGGLNYPTKYVMFDGSGRVVLTMYLTAMQINPPVDPKLFQKPSK